MYQTKRSIILCRGCQLGILPTKVKDHFKDAHKEDKVKVDSNCISVVAHKLNIPPVYPEPWTKGPYMEVAGLAVLTGFKCPDCTRVSTSTIKLRQLYTTDHPEKKGLVPKSWIPCHIQQIHPTMAKQLWWTTPADTPAPSSTEQTLAGILSKVDKWLEMEPMARDSRAITPWLLACKWHLYIGSLSKPQLIQLVAHPAHNSSLFPLSYAIKEYFAHCERFLSETDVLILQYLNSPDPSQR